jgi:hypothetical protein
MKNSALDLGLASTFLTEAMAQVPGDPDQSTLPSYAQPHFTSLYKSEVQVMIQQKELFLSIFNVCEAELKFQKSKYTRAKKIKEIKDSSAPLERFLKDLETEKKHSLEKAKNENASHESIAKIIAKYHSTWGKINLELTRINESLKEFLEKNPEEEPSVKKTSNLTNFTVHSTSLAQNFCQAFYVATTKSLFGITKIRWNRRSDIFTTII